MAKRPPLIPPADAHAETYRRRVARLMRSIHAETKRRIMPLLRAAVRERDEEARGDGLMETWTLIEREIMGVQIASSASVRRDAERIARAHVESVARYEDRGIMRQVSAVVGMAPVLPASSVEGLLGNMIRQNTDLIVTVPERYFGSIQQAVERGLTSGMRIDTLAARVDGIYEVSDFNAYRIARDQTAKIQSQIAQARHRELGVTHYVWRTSADERVRPEHAAMNGKRVAYAYPPAETGHPGDDIMCRCTQEPDLSVLTEGFIEPVDAVPFEGEVL